MDEHASRAGKCHCACFIVICFTAVYSVFFRVRWLLLQTRTNAVMLAEQGNAGLNKVMQELDTLRNEVTTQGQALKKEAELRAALEKAAKDAGSSNSELKATYEKQLMDLQATVDQLRQQNADLQKALDQAGQGGGEGNDEQVKALEAANAALTADLATARATAAQSPSFSRSAT